MFELQVRISEIRIMEVLCWEIFKGLENFVRISKSSNATSSNYTELAIVLCNILQYICNMHATGTQQLCSSNMLPII